MKDYGYSLYNVRKATSELQEHEEKQVLLFKAAQIILCFNSSKKYFTLSNLFLNLKKTGQQKYVFLTYLIYSISSELVYFKVYYTIWSYKDMLEN